MFGWFISFDFLSLTMARNLAYTRIRKSVDRTNPRIA